jgi:hypothetical protein
VQGKSLPNLLLMTFFLAPCGHMGLNMTKTPNTSLPQGGLNGTGQIDFKRTGEVYGR